MSKPRIMIGADPASGPGRAVAAIIRGGVIESTVELAQLRGFDPAALNARIDAEYTARSAAMRDHLDRVATVFGFQDDRWTTRTLKTVEPVSVSFATPSNDKNGKSE